MLRALRVGIIGAGRIGRQHAATAQAIAGCEVPIIADPFGDAAANVAAEFGIASSTLDHKDVIDHPDLDAVLICSSTDQHAIHIMEAAAAGKHIFCEKPVDLELATVDDALAAADAAGVLLQVGFNRRFDPSFARARAAVTGGEIGDVHTFHITSRDPGPPPAEYVAVSGGLFRDCTIHDFDMARFLVGCGGDGGPEVDEVYARGACRVEPYIGEAGDVDTAVTMLTFTDGTYGTIENSRKAVYGYDQRVEVFGSGGVVRAENVHEDTCTVGDADGMRSALPQFFFMERYAESYKNEVEAFLACVRDGDANAVPCTGNDGRMALAVALAAKKSMDENRPVKMREILS